MPHRRSAVVIVAALVVLALLWLQTPAAAEGFSCSQGYQYVDGECKAK